MKTKRRILLFLLTVILLLGSCSSELTADGLAFRLLNLYPSLPPCSQYIKHGEKYEVGYLSPEDFAYLYTGESVKLPEWNTIEDFRLILSDTTAFFEIHVIRAKTTDQADEIAKLLDRRARLLSLHNKLNDDYPAEDPLVYVSGRYAILVATADNESARRLLDKLL